MKAIFYIALFALGGCLIRPLPENMTGARKPTAVNYVNSTLQT
jgi:hypothetical protein